MTQAHFSEENTVERCVSCDNPLAGQYCHYCGEKRIVPEQDFNLFSFLRETIGDFLNFDTKVIRSYLVFFFRPGQLTLAWIQGQRKPYMKPLTLFLSVAVAVHFFLPTTNVYFELIDALREGYDQKQPWQNLLNYDIGSAIAQKSHERGISQAEFYTLAFKVCWEKSKLFLISIPPFWALCIWGLYYSKNRYYLPHLVFALHGFALFMAIDLFFLLIMSDLLKFDSINDLWFLPLFVGYGVYLWLALRRVYGKMGYLAQSLRFFCVLLALIGCIVIYRQLITIFTVMSM
jgi:hypothetical protein